MAIYKAQEGSVSYLIPVEGVESNVESIEAGSKYNFDLHDT
ncbi:hypothetical protein PIIN_11267 [Serendipita indica DSM 11827]|uniref:Uncharacterized protein n=1 Tax=Serendipita indica (strain DSM 11827) TaxID=1109443 RepID=G4U146_SERID|nr:hypothetical protein PIIN_11267 [Serendipita indica DSM 11827]